ncbi:hypothetical protein HNQ94_001862 [Salirhabdus euzebyi]|uniref:DUF378 domain-containing protein n=1 Tax=Salirhabdus euzebyi TaxID=394506 RepID=A0A841Q4Y1_9BACI|nr:DUF378 domain-containing protein [Salirhabdus euzebyi]MBB6453413.1 hypothetical protein [Salirhabdus euzebyi]
MNGFHKFCLFIAIVGAINWGLIGFFQYDLVASLLGGGEQDAIIPRIVYAVVGLCGLALIPLLFKGEEH